MGNLHNLVITLVVALNSIDLSSQSQRVPKSKGESSQGEPLREALLRAANLGEVPPLREVLRPAPLRSAPPLRDAPLRDAPSRDAPSRDAPPAAAPLREAPILAAPLRAVPSQAGPSQAGRFQAGPSSLVITFAQPEPHGVLKYRNIAYPAGFQKKKKSGGFSQVPSNKPVLSLTTDNGYVLGVLRPYNQTTLTFFGIYAEFDGKPHRFKIPIEDGKPVLMHPEEEREFPDFRKFVMDGEEIKRYDPRA